MKIALYTISEYGNAFIFRLMDGEWTALRPKEVIRESPEATWQALSTVAGMVCDGYDVVSGEGFTCLTSSREAARAYGIPENVELYKAPVLPEPIPVDPFFEPAIPDDAIGDSLIPIAKYAEARGLAANSVRHKCIRGTLPGAVKLGRDWFIPADAPYPDARVKSGRYKNWRQRPAK